jgi:hypothetical protein
MQTDNVELRTIVLTCANTLLTSLLSLTGSPTSVQISDSFMEKINLLYGDLESCDYIGMCETHKMEHVPLVAFNYAYGLILRGFKLPNETTHAKNL